MHSVWKVVSQCSRIEYMPTPSVELISADIKTLFYQAAGQESEKAQGWKCACRCAVHSGQSFVLLPTSTPIFRAPSSISDYADQSTMLARLLTVSGHSKHGFVPV